MSLNQRTRTVISASEYASSLVPAEKKDGMSVRSDSETGQTASLVCRCQDGDVDAFGELVGLYEKRVFHFVLRMTRQAHDAEDITQETFVKVWRNIRRFRSEYAFSTWLFTIARRTALNHLRASKPTQELADYDEPVHNNPAKESEDRERASSIWNIARKLKPAQYEALWLRYGEGFAVDEAAKVMGTNSVRVRVLLHRGRKRMAELLNKREFQPGAVL